MKRKILFVIGVVLLLACAGGAWFCARRPECPTFSATTRDGWIAQAVASLKEFKPSVLTPLARFRVYADGDGWYSIPGEGLIKFPNGDWVYIIAHSHHDRDGAPVGNAVLAVNNHGQIYQNDAHPCGGLGVQSTAGRRFQSFEEFLAALVNLPGRGGGWKELPLPNHVLENIGTNAPNPQH